MEIVFCILAIVFLVLWLTSIQQSKKTMNAMSFQMFSLQEDKRKLSEKISEIELKSREMEVQKHLAEKENQELSKYKGIVEVEKEIEKLLQTAKADASEIKSKADQNARTFAKSAETLLSNATSEAKRLIDEANKKAIEIAGDAYISLQNVKELEERAKAIRNIIQGYGNEYLVPTYSLLDDLAEEFQHTEAGEKLKFARERSKIMVKENTAALCDYAEANRKETAINFILDAFNGKVDSILSKVKKDNIGVLEQKVRDSFQLVNSNGTAFRNARITQEYLSARLEELKWAVITQELKWQEQEEQRQIKEQIREEEKARRDFERAIKEAQKEEETLKKLIEKAQREVAQAGEEQKAKYEEKLHELELKLQVAEDKNQRAISMAQQTKSGNVYIISNIGSFGENVYKIGMTRRLEPLDRIRELGDASVPFEFDVHSMIYSDDAPALERELHKKFLRLQMNKINPRKEFFKIELGEIKAEVDRMNINAKWTMTAEARQYRETIILEKEMANNKDKQLEWEKYQMQLDPISAEVEEEVVEQNS